MLRRKLEEIELYNSTISQSRNRKQKCYKCRQRGHIIKNCPEKKKVHDEGTKKPGNTSILMKGQESAKLVNKELMTTKPTEKLWSKMNAYLEKYFESLEKGDNSGEGMKTVGMISMKSKEPYIQQGVPKQEHNLVLDIPTKIVEEGKEYTCLTSHQHIVKIKAPSMEATRVKGKEKVEHFGVKLEDVKRELDSHHFQPIQSNIKGNLTLNKNFQGFIKRPKNSEPADKEDINSNSSDDFTIIT
ncbi:ARID DNA-binding domain-containing protein [Tanacetum coccineum]